MATDNMANLPVFPGYPFGEQTGASISGRFLEMEGEMFYCIWDYDRMRPFLMSIVSDSDHWMFISSNGALTAGRRNPEDALFPYVTDDKIHDSADLTGSKTIILAEKEGKRWAWEPFSNRNAGLYAVKRRLFKSLAGNRILFEEDNETLGLKFRYSWAFSEKYGFVRRANLMNIGSAEIKVEILDGIQNLLPYGVDLMLQTIRSTLVDAYKKNELVADCGLGIYRLSAIPVDKAEPSEALKVSTVWSTGLEGANYLLSSRQLDAFRAGKGVSEEIDVRAERGAYFLNKTIRLAEGEDRYWYMVAETGQGSVEAASLQALLASDQSLPEMLMADIQAGTDRLIQLVAAADGLQLAEDRTLTARHYSNVMFNIMRGGIFADTYQIDKEDLLAYIELYDKEAAGRNPKFIDILPDRLDVQQLSGMLAQAGDPDLIRICKEYLPLMFSRRHGDPSRPWNRFSIDLKGPDGGRVLNYEGNWRDIFQNWEALAMSYPDFIEGMVLRFLNASTADGYNPYRITREGIDWEEPDPSDPWAHIGYWGDHQIIYLLKLLEISAKFTSDAFSALMEKQIFAYANVPYRIQAYESILEDPYDTVHYDKDESVRIAKRVADKGSDGKLVFTENGSVFRVNLLEKLLVPLLTKLSNFVPEAGIWLNTQRPEWNDANNALVGNGASMVTLYYMRRYLAFLREMLAGNGQVSYSLTIEVGAFMGEIGEVLKKNEHTDANPFSADQRRALMDGLGEAGSRYRKRIYSDGFSGTSTKVAADQLDAFLALCLRHADHAIRANKRPDGLYHAYNLIIFNPDGGVSIRRLYEMLEGQVAVLSSGALSPEEASEVLDALRHSSMFWEGQHSYLLYPDRELPRFTQFNIIPEEGVQASRLLRRLLEQGDTSVVLQDIFGQCHFNGDFRNADDLSLALDRLSDPLNKTLLKDEKGKVLDLFEKVFDHKSFTGRSGTFYGYEGLGCIYWHMVSKLLLAVAENCQWAEKAGSNPDLIRKLIAQYYDIRLGIGFNKSPGEYGAFPSDPYSHTPGDGGARQPGMTGQVKEDILSRFMELGVEVSGGQVAFRPFMLKKSEFLSEPSEFGFFDQQGEWKRIPVKAGNLAFTYCQTPVIYRLSDREAIRIWRKDGSIEEITGNRLTAEASKALSGRTGEIIRIEVDVTLL